MNKGRDKRYSVGVACVRYNKAGAAEVLLVQKRYSYAYSQFAFGDWGPIKTEGLAACVKPLLAAMTIEEKLQILSLDFDKIWYRIWLRDYKPKSYFIVKQKFDKYFINEDGGAALKKWLSDAPHGGEIWEIPKGRRNRGESEINAAVREFREETLISKEFYQLLIGLKVRDSVTDDGITYVSTYHIALVDKGFEPRISVCSSQINEIIDIKWCSVNDVLLLKNERLLRSVRSIFKIVKKYLKGKMFRPVIIGKDKVVKPPPGFTQQPLVVENKKARDEKYDCENILFPPEEEAPSPASTINRVLPAKY